MNDNLTECSPSMLIFCKAQLTQRQKKKRTARTKVPFEKWLKEENRKKERKNETKCREAAVAAQQYPINAKFSYILPTIDELSTKNLCMLSHCERISLIHFHSLVRMKSRVFFVSNYIAFVRSYFKKCKMNKRHTKKKRTERDEEKENEQ